MKLPPRREFSGESNEREVTVDSYRNAAYKSRGIAGDSKQGPFVSLTYGLIIKLINVDSTLVCNRSLFLLVYLLTS